VTPGGTSSRPSKNLVTSALERSVIGVAEWALYLSAAASWSDLSLEACEMAR
jgi:hypothetical protein